ncbi:MAG: elongation factor G-binding protein [Paenibacillus sp.]|nr:elongation factor G-binding protein [Paenibacillus sp.]
MNLPFIHNHQYNAIHKQGHLLQRAYATLADPKVLESLEYSAIEKIKAAFPDATKTQLQMLEAMASLRTPEQFHQFEHALEPYRLSAGQPLGEKQLQKLYPKVKKLKTPDLTAVDFRAITYLGWLDIAQKCLYIVYPLDGQWVGIRGNFTPANKGVCAFCNRHEEVALFSAIAKSRPPGASPDYYKAVGHYICTDSAACNRNMTDVTVLEKFIREVTS